MYNLIQKFVFFIIAANYFLLPLPSTAAESVQLVGYNEVRLEKNLILLKDLVRVNTSDRDLKYKIELVEIGMTPPIGRIRTIDEKDIRLRLKRDKIESENIEILLSQPIEVMRASIEISPQFIKSEVREYLERNVLVEEFAFSVKEINWSGQVILPSGEVALQIQPKYQTNNFIGNVPLIVLFKVDGQLEKRLSVVAKVEMIAKVVVARNPISRGQIIQDSDLELRALELSQIKGQAIMDTDSIIGKRTKHQIYPQQVILDNDVEIPPILKRGDTVKIIVAFSNLTATARGLVKENGRVGEKIKVVNIDSKKSLYATVIDQHTVKIEF